MGVLGTKGSITKLEFDRGHVFPSMYILKVLSTELVTGSPAVGIEAVKFWHETSFPVNILTALSCSFRFARKWLPGRWLGAHRACKACKG